MFWIYQKAIKTQVDEEDFWDLKMKDGWLI